MKAHKTRRAAIFLTSASILVVTTLPMSATAQMATNAIGGGPWALGPVDVSQIYAQIAPPQRVALTVCVDSGKAPVEVVDSTNVISNKRVAPGNCRTFALTLPTTATVVIDGLNVGISSGTYSIVPF